MCLMLYLGADRELPTTATWSHDRPTFHVVARAEPPAAVARHLGTPHVYYVGSHEGCGCGFGYESSEDYEQTMRADMPEDVRAVVRGDRAARVACMDALRAYLYDVTAQGPVKLLVTVADREDAPIEHQAVVSADYFGGDRCSLAENSVFEIRHR